jgi:hypothetical protein
MSMLIRNIRLKKVIFLTPFLGFLVFYILFFVSPVFAQIPVSEGVDILTPSGLTQTDPRQIVAKVIKGFLGLLGILAISLIVYGGYLWITSQGDPTQVEKARNLLKNAAIGLLIILTAYAIVAYIFGLLLKALGGGESFTLQDPSFGRGALGSGVIQSHYPPRDATDIPRNTSIIITFKVPMNFESIARFEGEADGNPGPTWGDEWRLFQEWDDTPTPNGVKDPGEEYTFDDVNNSGGVKDDYDLYRYSIDISFKDADEKFHQFDGRVYTIQSEFNAGQIKTIVVVPLENLGSLSEDIWHTVRLREMIKTKSGDDPFNPVNYAWKFQTNRTIDTSPPYIVGMDAAPGYTDPAPGENDLNYWDEAGPYNGKRVLANVIPLASKTKELYNGSLIEKCNGVGTRGDRTGDSEIKEIDNEFDCAEWPRNVLVQINFSEAVNPVTTAGRDSFMGVYEYSGTSPSDQFYLNPNAPDPNNLKDWKKVKGEFKLSSDYRTAEFWPDERDGVNSCGDVIYILPGNAILRTYVKSATSKVPDVLDPNYTPQAEVPWDGVVDAASNALDGNADGYVTTDDDTDEDVNPNDGNDDPQAFPPHTIVIPTDYVGPPQRVDYDDFIWIFDTSDEIDVTSPLLVQTSPIDGKEYANDDEPYFAEFSKFMSLTSFTPNDTFYSRDADITLTPWNLCTEVSCTQGNLVNFISGKLLDFNPADDKEYDHSVANVYHESFLTSPTTFYNPIPTKSLKDLFQNCFEGACKKGEPDDIPPGVDKDYDGNAPVQINEATPQNSDCSAYQSFP